MRRFAVRLFDRPQVPWLYIILAILALHAAEHADDAVRFNGHWMVWLAPFGVALAAVAVFSAGLQHHKMQLLVIALVSLFMGADTPNPVRFPGLHVNHALYAVAAVALIYAWASGENEWQDTNLVNERSRRVAAAATGGLAIAEVPIYWDSTTASIIVLAAIAAVWIWYAAGPSKFDYMSEYRSKPVVH